MVKFGSIIEPFGLGTETMSEASIAKVDSGIKRREMQMKNIRCIILF